MEHREKFSKTIINYILDMRTLLSAIANLLIFTTVISQSTQVPIVNGDFEAPFSNNIPPLFNPIQGLSNCPGWYNYYSIDSTTANSGSQSLKVSTTVSNQINQVMDWGNDTVPGSTYSDPIQGNWSWDINSWGSISVNFYSKHQIASGDSALVLFYLSPSGTLDDVCAIGYMIFTGTENNWQNHTLNFIDYFSNICGNPNANAKLIFQASSTFKTRYLCNGCNNYNVQNGIAESALWIDDITVSYIDLNASSEIFGVIDSKIYPNPVTDKINIKISDEIKSVELFDMQGDLVLKSNKSEIDASDLCQGIYTYIIRTVTDKSSYGKVIKIN
jgi:hypothetical protein